MALPVLNDFPKYSVVIPSSKKKVQFRPFLVKEQKILLMALESQDQEQIINGLIDIMKGCLYDVDVNSLTMFDLEYLFTQIRSKSVGETSKIGLKCTECDHTNIVDIKLDDIQLKEITTSNKIKLNDQYMVEMRYPTLGRLTKDPEAMFKPMNTRTEAVYEMILQCMYSLKTEDEVILFENETREEIDKFLGGLTSTQFEDIGNFVLTIPTLNYDVDFTCENCSHENKQTLEGLQDFF